MTAGGPPTETRLAAELGDVALLPCYSLGNVTPYLTVWVKAGNEVSRGDGSSSNTTQRLAVLQDGSLSIGGVAPGDAGSYLCNSSLPGNRTHQARVLLQVTGKWLITGTVTGERHAGGSSVQHQNWFCNMCDRKQVR